MRPDEGTSAAGPCWRFPTAFQTLEAAGVAIPLSLLNRVGSLEVLGFLDGATVTEAVPIPLVKDVAADLHESRDISFLDTRASSPTRWTGVATIRFPEDPPTGWLDQIAEQGLLYVLAYSDVFLASYFFSTGRVEDFSVVRMRRSSSVGLMQLAAYQRPDGVVSPFGRR